jgi:hypothetical protein
MSKPMDILAAPYPFPIWRRSGDAAPQHYASAMLVTPFAVHQNKVRKAIRGEINTQFLITESKTSSITLLARSHSGIYGPLILHTLGKLQCMKQVTKTSIWVGSKIN